MTDSEQIKPLVPPPAEAEVLPAKVKLQATIGIERAILPLFVAGIVVLGVLGFLAGGNHGNGIIQSEKIIFLGMGMGGLCWAVAALIWICVDDYYVLDRRARRILLHKGLRFFGEETPFLEAEQIVAIGMDCSKSTYKGAQYGWRFTPVILTKKGEMIRLSVMDANLDCDKLGIYNKKVRLWAAALGCSWIECPTKKVFQVQQYFEESGPMNV